VSGHYLHGRHVDLVQVGPLLAVHLDGDKVLVENLGRLEILEKFQLHDVTPVTGRVADGEKDRLVFLFRAPECLLRPREPVDRVMGVLQQIGAVFARQPVDMVLGRMLRWGWSKVIC